MEKFYIRDIRTLSDPKDNPSVMEGLLPKRQHKCLMYIQADDRKRSLGAGIIINQILMDFKYTGNVTEGVNGKPEAAGIFFNISHSGNYVIGVASDTPVGCDIEKMDSAPLKIADNFFYDSEKDYIISHSDKDFAFWQLWTLKESYMKMTGEGMSLPLNSFRVVIKNVAEIYRNNEKQPCILSHFTHDGHMIAICKRRKL